MRPGIYTTLMLTLVPSMMACAAMPGAEGPAPADPLPGEAASADARVVAVALAANGAAAELANLAVKRASHPLVRELACLLVHQQEEAGQALQDASELAGMPASRTPEAERVEAELDAVMVGLRSRWGMSFDRAWLNANTRLGEWLSVRLDDATLAAVDDRHLRESLERIRDGAGTTARDMSSLGPSLVGFHY